MPYDFSEDKVNGSAEDSANEIDPRDTYGSRFSVTSRRVSNSSSPRSAILSGTRRIRNSDKIFTKKHEHGDLGGRVNMENVSNKKFDNTKEANNQEQKDQTTNKKNEKKSSGLDSLFESTTDKKPVSKFKTETDNSFLDSDIKKRKNTDAVKSKRNEVQNRPLKVIKPISFNSAKEISSALKAGSAVVLCLKNINEENARRLLDFSFGAAAMCGAKVSLEAQKTYVLTIGPGLSQREKLLCIKEGVALKVDED